MVEVIYNDSLTDLSLIRYHSHYSGFVVTNSKLKKFAEMYEYPLLDEPSNYIELWDSALEKYYTTRTLSWHDIQQKKMSLDKFKEFIKDFFK